MQISYCSLLLSTQSRTKHINMCTTKIMTEEIKILPENQHSGSETDYIHQPFLKLSNHSFCLQREKCLDWWQWKKISSKIQLFSDFIILNTSAMVNILEKLIRCCSDNWSLYTKIYWGHFENLHTIVNVPDSTSVEHLTNICLLPETFSQVIRRAHSD